MRERRADRFLDEQFRDFYREVIRWKSRVRAGEAVFEDGLPGTGSAEDASSAVWQVLLTVLERQALKARRSGGDLAVAIFRQAQYVMAALADEIFLHLDWPGREAWRNHLLEAKLFGSHRAGEVVFERIDDILRQRDVVFLELASVYLMALGLGFEGKFRGSEHGQDELAGYRNRLFQFIHGREPDLGDARRHLIPEAYSSTLEQGMAKRLPYLRNWLLGFAAVFLIWIVTGQYLWSRLTTDLNEILQSIH